MTNQINELLEMFPKAAGIWLDGFSTPASGDSDLFKYQELYDMIHSKQPQVLVYHKQDMLGTENFLAPERKYKANEKPEKPLEIFDHLQKKG